TTRLSWSRVAKLEVEAALDSIDGGGGIPIVPRPLIGSGIGHAFDLGRLILRDKTTGADVTETERDRIGHVEFDEMMAEANLEMDRGVLAGPTDAEETALRSRGWAPEEVHAYTERRARQEREQAARFDERSPKWRKGRTRDFVSVIELLGEYKIQDSMARRGPVFAAMISKDLSLIPNLVRSIPSAEVWIGLKTAMHRDANRRWTTNDIHDLDALALAVPYCDVVVTEASAHTLLTAAHLDRRMGTVILRRPTELVQQLQRGSD
nr:hypothetical protein [Micromonospora sp. DSM 115978]